MQIGLELRSGILTKSELHYTQQKHKAVCYYCLSQTGEKGKSQTLLCRAEGELAEKVSKINENSYITVIGRMETVIGAGEAGIIKECFNTRSFYHSLCTCL